jgi:hypothetical protein
MLTRYLGFPFPDLLQCPTQAQRPIGFDATTGNQPAVRLNVHLEKKGRYPIADGDLGVSKTQTRGAEKEDVEER